MYLKINIYDYYYIMVYAYLLLFPAYTLFLAFATYTLFFQTDKLGKYITDITSSHEILEEKSEEQSEKKSEEQSEKKSEEEKSEEEKSEEKEEKEEKKELTPEERAFEEFKKTDKYKFLVKYKLDKLDDDICNKDKNNNNIVFEYVPFMDSIVVMGYDFDNQYYSYWSDKTIPFYVLNVVAIKYVTEFNRTHLFLNEVEKVEEEKENSVFVKTHDSEKKIENRYTKNHFKHRGKLYELNVNLNNEKEHKPKIIDFNTFSKMFDENTPELNLKSDRKKSV